MIYDTAKNLREYASFNSAFEAIAKFIMWVMKKLGKVEERYIKWFCVVFSLLPVLLYIAFVLSFSFLYLFI